jgi:hypothetical protein
LIGIEGAAVPDAADLDLIPVCELTRYEMSLYLDRNRSRPVAYWVIWDHLERQDPDLILSADRALLYAACCPMNDHSLKTLRGWTFA